MTAYELGMSQPDWEVMRKALRDKKRPTVIDAGIVPGDAGTSTVDSTDVTLDIWLNIIHLDVGQGESTLITLTCEPDLCRELGLSPCLLSILIDGGVQSDGGGILLRAFALYGIQFLDAAIISHFDKDHVEGVTRVLQRGVATVEAPPQSVPATGAEIPASAEGEMVVVGGPPEEGGGASAVDGSIPATSEAAGGPQVSVGKIILRCAPLGAKDTGVTRSLAKSLELYDDVRTVVITKDDELTLECDADKRRFKMTCIAVNSASGGSATDEEAENANSIAWLLTFGKYRYYTAGDLPTVLGNVKYEDSLGPSIKDPLTGMKCGHHGSEGSTSKVFLDAVKPRLAFISSGKQDKFGHPNTDTLLRLQAAADLEAVFITNCYKIRPFIDEDYVAIAAAEVQEGLGDALDRLTKWIARIPALDDAAEAIKPSESTYPRELRTRRLELRDLIMNLRQLVPLLVPVAGVVPAEHLRAVKAAQLDLNKWKSDSGAMLIRLRAGFGVAGDTGAKTVKCQISVEERSFTLALSTLSSMGKIAGELERAQAVLKALKGEPTEGASAETTAASVVPTRTGPAFHLAGRHDTLGNVTFLMNLEDAAADDRVCWVGYEQSGGWFPFVYPPPTGMPPMTDLSPQEAMETPQKTGRSPNEAWLHVLSLAALTSQTVPGSPGTYVGRVEKRRKEYKTRKHDELRNDTIKPEEPQTKRVRLDDESVLGSSVDETPPPTIDGEDRMEAINAEDM